MKIIGAGLSGLIAGCHWRDAEILESMPEPEQRHKALLRFRSPEIGRLTGIKFREVTVRKAIWESGNFVEPNIRSANQYSMKILGRLAGRSIWELDKVKRWIAPEDFYARLIDRMNHRISWRTNYDFRDAAKSNEVVVTTAPMPQVLKHFEPLGEEVEFNRAPIWVSRFRIKHCDNIYQTVYFPSGDLSVYRASITGDLLIIESVAPIQPKDLVAIYDAFGIYEQICLAVGQVDKQQYGKIADIDPVTRRHIIAKLSTDHNLYSLGRFATYRNILLDDLIQDMSVIDRMIVSDEYNRRLI